MKAAREALELILNHHEPYPAIVMDINWNIVMRNEAASRIVNYCVGADALRQLFPDGMINFVELMFAPNGLRPHIVNWTHSRAALLRRLRREAAGNAGSPSETLRRKFDHDTPRASDISFLEESIDPILPLELRIGDTRLRLFNTFTTFGTPQDVSLQELRIDMSFPADEVTRRFLDAAARDGIEGVPALRQDA
jgi:hypothetical protein